MRFIPGPSDDDYVQRGQLPVFVPNYYRGAVAQFPRTAGRSSQLFNTGAVSWMYRFIVEGLFGFKGSPEGLRIDPNLPGEWQRASVTRRFRNATFVVGYRRGAQCTDVQMLVDGEAVTDCVIRNIQAGRTYRVELALPSGTK